MSANWDFEEDQVVNPLIIYDVEQGTQAWLDLRCGNITGSKFSDVLAGGNGLVRDKYRVQLAIERITGNPITMDYKSAAMINGSQDEPFARAHYEFVNDVDSVQVAFAFHPTIKRAGCSPDSLIGDDGLLEIKCPNMVTHVNYLLDKKIPGVYLKQMHWQMACTGRDWCDFVSFDPRLPEHMQLFVKRVEADPTLIASLEAEVSLFLGEVMATITQLTEIYQKEAA